MDEEVISDIKGYFDYVLPLVLESGKVATNPKKLIKFIIRHNKHTEAIKKVNEIPKITSCPCHIKFVMLECVLVVDVERGEGASPPLKKILLEAHDIQATLKNGDEGNLVTIYDTKIEEILIQKIREKYPTHKFIGEEESEINDRISKLTSEPTWIIDPIDGTSNFVKGLPLTCISVGLTINKRQIIGIVFNPYMNELYTAIKGQGAYLNGQRIYTSKLKEIKHSIFNYELSLARTSTELYNLYMYRLKHLIKVVSGIRSLGCAVIGLCYVACGRLDAYQCDGLYPWDAAAGVLIVKEAGGHVVDTTGKEFDLMDPNYLATATEELSSQFMKIEKQADEEMVNELESNKEFVP